MYVRNSYHAVTYFWRHITLHRHVSAGWSQILAESNYVHVRISQVPLNQTHGWS